jgi:hypothetical protein
LIALSLERFAISGLIFSRYLFGVSTSLARTSAPTRGLDSAPKSEDAARLKGRHIPGASAQQLQNAMSHSSKSLSQTKGDLGRVVAAAPAATVYALV